MKEAEEDKELDRKAFTNTYYYWPIIECSAKKGDVFFKERKKGTISIVQFATFLSGDADH